LLLRHVRRYANIQGDIAYNQGFEDDPYTLWLDFESGISPTPKNFFNPRPIVLARDKKKWCLILKIIHFGWRPNWRWYTFVQ
jgi:hypothetical protein